MKEIFIFYDVRDQNDNFPEFTNDTLEVFVSEALAPGDIIGAVHATDQDSGRFGSQGIRYTHITGSIRYSKIVFNK